MHAIKRGNTKAVGYDETKAVGHDESRSIERWDIKRLRRAFEGESECRCIYVANEVDRMNERNCEKVN